MDKDTFLLLTKLNFEKLIIDINMNKSNKYDSFSFIIDRLFRIYKQ